MCKERFTLNQIKKILSSAIEAWDEFEKHPDSDDACTGWLQEQLNEEDLAEIIRLIKINDLIMPI